MGIMTNMMKEMMRAHSDSSQEEKDIGFLEVAAKIDKMFEAVEVKCCDSPELVWNNAHTKSICIFCGKKGGIESWGQ